MANITFEEVYQYFEKEGCKLLSTEYINNSTKLNYICQCGHEHNVSFHHFKYGKCRVCPKCKQIELHKRQAYSYEYVKEFIENNGYKLLSSEYCNNHSKLKIIAKCGHIHITYFAFIKKIIDKGEDIFCRKCYAKNKMGKTNLHSYDFVKNIFKDNGCILIDKEYFGNKFKLKYIAQCGHEHSVMFNNFYHHNRGRVCPTCAIKKNSGETHYLYNKNLTEEERIYRRTDKKNVEFRNNVFERDDYTCQITGVRGGDLAAHHLKSYSLNPELRFDINNGITLSKDFHRFAHKIFGKNDNVDIGELVEVQFLWDSGCR